MRRLANWVLLTLSGSIVIALIVIGALNPSGIPSMLIIFVFSVIGFFWSLKKVRQGKTCGTSKGDMEDSNADSTKS